MTTRENNKRTQRIMAATVSMGTVLLVTSQASAVHAAALEETAKNTGSKVITFLILLTVVLGGSWCSFRDSDDGIGEPSFTFFGY